ncbi:MAG: hypothetical protein JWL74_681 [Alphaproteobacteria bacterium]|jgi:hypothetical protein|nr:hypothetical protein [Alphaproteobacteria bacterium]
MAIDPIQFPPLLTPASPTQPTATSTSTPPSNPPSTSTGARRESDSQERPTYPAGTLRDSIRQKPTPSAGWDIVDNIEASAAPETSADPTLTAAAIMKNALAAMLAQANVDRQGALSLLLR